MNKEIPPLEAITHAESCYRDLLNNPVRMQDFVETFGDSTIVDHFKYPFKNLSESLEDTVRALSMIALSITHRALDEVYPSAHDDLGKCAVGTVVVCGMFQNELPIYAVWPIAVTLAKHLGFAEEETQLVFAVMATKTYRTMWELRK